MTHRLIRYRKSERERERENTQNNNFNDNDNSLHNFAMLSWSIFIEIHWKKKREDNYKMLKHDSVITLHYYRI